MNLIQELEQDLQRQIQAYLQPNENIKKVTDFPEYYVSDHGQVFSTKFNKVRLLQQPLQGNPNQLRPAVTFCDGSSRRRVKVHQLVAQHFIPKTDTIRNHVCHNNGDRMNNHVDNLRWATHKENMQDKIKHNTCYRPTGTKNPHSKLSPLQVFQIRELLAKGNTKQTDIAKMFNVNPNTISRINTNTTWTSL